MKLFDYAKDIIGLGSSKEEDQFDSEYFKNTDEVLSFVKAEFTKRQKEKQPYELQWNLNMNFLNGNQYCDINLGTSAVMQIDRDFDWEEREVFNHIAPIFETRLAKLSKVLPSPFVRPSNGTNKAESAAKISKCVLEGVDINQNMNKKRMLATSWAEICGCSFIGDRWESKNGRTIFEIDGQDFKEGDLEKEVITPFEIFPDSPFSQGIQGCRSIIRAKALTVDEIYDRWGIEVKGKKVDVFTLNQTTVGTGGLNRNATIFNFIPTKADNSEIVIEYMELPNRKHEQGLHIIIAGDELLYYGAYIYRVGEDGNFGFPFSMQICIETPGRFWPVSIIERLIPIQRSYNAVKNRKKEILNRKAIGNWAVEDDGNVNVEDLESQGFYPGKIHLYPRGGKPPVEIVSRGNTSDFNAEEQSLLDEFTTVSGVSPFASQSLPPTGSNSGKALESIKDADDTRIGLTVNSINIAAIESYKIDLRMYRQFATMPRLLRHVGKNNNVQLIEWVASDLSSDDIVIEKEDELSQSPAQRRQMVLDLLQYRLFSNDVDPKNRSKIISLLELGDWENSDDIEDLHINRALRENMMLKQGVIMQVKDYDLHDLHIQEHNRLRLDTEYEELEKANPMLVMAFNQHVFMHEQLKARQNMASIQQANLQQQAIQQQQAALAVADQAQG